METLPIWLQWLVSFTSILSSAGVIVAFVQLRESSDQSRRQMKLTEDQFRLLNQGYIQVTVSQLMYVYDKNNNLQPVDQIDDATRYYATALISTMQNVGNMPIKMDVKHCIVYMDGKEIYRTDEAALKKTINNIYPQVTLPFNFGAFYLGKDGVTIRELTDMKITYDLLIEYHDFNDTRIKTIDRGMELFGVEILIRRSDDVI